MKLAPGCPPAAPVRAADSRLLPGGDGYLTHFTDDSSCTGAAILLAPNGGFCGGLNLSAIDSTCPFSHVEAGRDGTGIRASPISDCTGGTCVCRHLSWSHLFH